MSRPWMPLYVADYLADTGHLNTIEHGAYLLLIMHYWQKGGLPDDDRRLASIARASLEQWQSMSGTIAEFFSEGWKHPRIDAELESAEKAYERRASAGRAGGKAKAKGKQSSGNARAMLQQSQPHIEDTDASASGGASPADPRDALWAEGVSTLKAMTGKTDSASRQMIGKWLKDAKDDCALVLSKIRTAKDERIGDPISWITAALKPPDKQPPPARNAGVLAQRQLKAINDAPIIETRHLNQGDTGADFAGPSLPGWLAVASGR